MKHSTVVNLITRTATVAILVTAVGCIVCLGAFVDGYVYALIPAVFLSLLGCFVMYAARRNIQSRRPRAARRRFLETHSLNRDSPDSSGIAHFDADAMVLGSSAWLIQNDLTSAFPRYGSFTDSLNAFDHDVFASHSSVSTFDDDVFTSNFSLNTFDSDAFTSNFSHHTFENDLFNDAFATADWVHGGTDITGLHGMGGHNDQGWGTDSSFSSTSDSFSSYSHESSSSCSHDCFGSSSHDPFA